LPAALGSQQAVACSARRHSIRAAAVVVAVVDDRCRKVRGSAGAVAAVDRAVARKPPRSRRRKTKAAKGGSSRVRVGVAADVARSWGLVLGVEQAASAARV